MCLNRRMLIGLAAVAVGVLAIDPHVFIRVLPFLFFAICPLSMVLMVWGMRKAGGRQKMSSSSQSCGMSSNSGGVMGMDSKDMGQRGAVSPSSAAAENEIAHLRAEVDQLRAELSTRTQGEADTWR